MVIERRFVRLALVSLALFCAVPLQAAPSRGQSEDRFVRGELLVGFRGGVGEAGRQKFIRLQGSEQLEQIGGGLRVVRMRVPANGEDALIARLSSNPEVKFVQKNYEYTPALLPNDPEYLGQWHLPVINAPQAWDMSMGGPAGIIAILDSGVDATQPDLAGKLVPGYNTYNNNTDTSDAYGHGTEVAGVAAARTNNTVGIAGVAGNALIMPVRVTNDAGTATSASIANGIIWATDHGARVINLSFNDVASNATVLAAAEYAYNKGTLVVAASGNCACANATVETPFILSVSGSDETDHVASFSTTGPFVDVAAPGNNILATAKFGLYTSESGTSLASPVVTGIAALMFDAQPALTPLLATEMLEASAIDVNGDGYDNAYGYGRVDAEGAVWLAVSYLPPPDTTPPSVALLSPATGATVHGTVVVDAAADDDRGVVKVDLHVDGALFASDATSPYSFALDTSGLSNGAHTLMAVASDAAGNSAKTSLLSVTVHNVPPDTTAPLVVINTPTAGSKLTGTVMIVADAVDDTAVVAVNFHVDGAMVGRATAAPYSVSWDSTQVISGPHTLEVSAADAAGNIGYASWSITVDSNLNRSPVAVADEYTIAYRSSGSYDSLTFPVLANDSDADGDLDVRSVRITSPPSGGGVARVGRNGMVIYMPARRFSGTETFSYTVRDARRHLSNTATVSVMIDPPPPPSLPPRDRRTSR
jgi:subtilisin family serine protease